MPIIQPGAARGGHSTEPVENPDTNPCRSSAIAILTSTIAPIDPAPQPVRLRISWSLILKPRRKAIPRYGIFFGPLPIYLHLLLSLKPNPSHNGRLEGFGRQTQVLSDLVGSKTGTLTQDPRLKLAVPLSSVPIKGFFHPTKFHGTQVVCRTKGDVGGGISSSGRSICNGKSDPLSA